MALLIKGLQARILGDYTRAAGLITNVKFEMLLAFLLMLTAGAVIWQDKILERTTVFTPANTAQSSHLVFGDGDTDGHSTVQTDAPLSWTCDLRTGNAYPYCGYELFFDRDKGIHGLDLSNMHSLKIAMMYRGSATSFRVHLKNFDPRYSHATDDDTPKYLRVEADTTPGKLQHATFVPADFGVADWWLRKYKLAPQFGRPQFDNVTSLVIETGSEAPLGHHEFQIREIVVSKAILSEAQWYSLVLGIWIVLIVAYLIYRIGNLRRALVQRRTLELLALREAQEAACQDHLTRLLNRRGLAERFANLLQERGDGLALSVILIDIDHFKALNDTYGHDFGDQVLADIATVISRNVRVVDMAARWGGEEFVVVCADVDRRSALKIAEKLRERIASFNFGVCGQITASLGVHWWQGPDPDLADLISQADLALYAAKAGGRNCYRLHQSKPKAA